MTHHQLSSSSTAQIEDLVGQMFAVNTVSLAVIADALPELERRKPWLTDGASSFEEWVSLRFKRPLAMAADLVRISRVLPGLPSIREAFHEGRLSFDEVAALCGFATPQTDAELAREAPGLSLNELRRKARRARMVTEEQEAQTYRKRSLRVRWDPDKQWLRLSGRIPGADGAKIRKALDRIADQTPPDPETGDYGTPEIQGGPPIPPTTLDRIMCDAHVEWLVEDTQGGVVGFAKPTRNIPAPLMRKLRHRDNGCRYPGWGRTYGLHAHHIRHRRHGGHTVETNLILLCRRHHRMLHEQGWQVIGDPRQPRLCWIRPDGRVHIPGPPAARPTLRRGLPWLWPHPRGTPG